MLKRLRVAAIASLCLLSGLAVAQSIDAVPQAIQQGLPDNNKGGITASGLRNTLNAVMKFVRLRTGRSQYDFGAKCDGSTDDTAALQAWLAAGASEKLVLAEGQCIFKQPLVANYDWVRIAGAGKTKAHLIYAGADATVDLITFGDGINIRQGFDVSDLRVRSITKMAQGSAMRIKYYQNAQNKLREVSFGDKLNGDYNLFNGPWFDNINVFSYTGFDIAASYDGIRVNGSGLNQTPSGSDLFLDDGVIVKATTGIRVGGGFGGLATGTVLLIANGTDVRVDTTLAQQQNREIFFGRNTVFDQTSQYGLYVDDALAGGSSITIDAFIGSAGKYRPELGGAGNNIYVANWKNSQIIVNSSKIFNARADNIVLADATTTMTFASSTILSDNGGYGVTATVPTSNVYGNPVFLNNGLGDKGPNIANPGWKLFTPAIQSQNGATMTITTNANQYKVIGGICYVYYDFTITNKGTAGATDAIVANLPAVARNLASFTGSEPGVSNRAIKGTAQPSQNLYVNNYDGTSTIQNNARILLSGFYDCK